MKPQLNKQLGGVFCLGLAVALMPISGWAMDSASSNPPPVQGVPPAPAVVPAPPATAVTPAPAAPATPPPPVTHASSLTYSSREVVKLISSGVPEDVVRTYIDNSPNMFNLTPDNIIELHEVGVANSITTAMLMHDKTMRQNNPSVVATPPVVVPTATTQQQPATTAQPPVATAPYTTSPGVTTIPQDNPDYSDYYNQLTSYGTWAYQPGYGWGWQPYYGLNYSYYPWGLLGYGYWNFLPNVGWCWFPRHYWGGNYWAWNGHSWVGYNHWNVFHPYSYNGHGYVGGYNHGFVSTSHGTWGGSRGSWSGSHMAGGGIHVGAHR